MHEERQADTSGKSSDRILIKESAHSVDLAMIKRLSKRDDRQRELLLNKDTSPSFRSALPPPPSGDLRLWK